MAAANDDPHLGEGPSEDSDILLNDYDSDSIFSEDSVLPDYEEDEKHGEPAKTLYEACARNDPTTLRQILERGVTKEEVMELDINGKVRRNWFSFLLRNDMKTSIHLRKYITHNIQVNLRVSEVFLPCFLSEWTNGGCGQGFCGYCHCAGHMSIIRHQPSRQ